MNPKTIALLIVSALAGAATGIAQAFPAFATDAHALIAICGVLVTYLGLASPQVLGEKK